MIMFGSFLPSLWSSKQPQSTRVEGADIVMKSNGTVRDTLSGHVGRHQSREVWRVMRAKALVNSAGLLDSQGVHGGNGGGAVGGNDGRKKRADRKRPRRYAQREGVPRGDAVQLRGEQAPGADGQGQPKDQPNQHALECPAEDEAKHLRAVRAERHANADFVGSLSNGIGGDAVEANRGKDQRDDAKQTGETGYGALLV